MGDATAKERGFWLAAELAERAKLTDARIRQLLIDGAIRGNKAGGTWTIPYFEGLRWLESRGVKVG